MNARQINDAVHRRKGKKVCRHDWEATGPLVGYKCNRCRRRVKSIDVPPPRDVPNYCGDPRKWAPLLEKLLKPKRMDGAGLELNFEDGRYTFWDGDIAIFDLRELDLGTAVCEAFLKYTEDRDAKTNV